MIGPDSSRSPGLQMWLWRTAVTVALLAMLLLGNLSDAFRLLVGIGLVTGLFVMAYDVARHYRGRSAR